MVGKAAKAKAITEVLLYGCINCHKALYWQDDHLSFYHKHNSSRYCLGQVGPVSAPIIIGVSQDGKRGILGTFTEVKVDLENRKHASVGEVGVTKWEVEYLYNLLEQEVIYYEEDDASRGSEVHQRIKALMKKILKVWKQPEMRNRP